MKEKMKSERESEREKMRHKRERKKWKEKSQTKTKVWGIIGQKIVDSEIKARQRRRSILERMVLSKKHTLESFKVSEFAKE